jgi:TP901 family phage tail tape measure protein
MAAEDYSIRINVDSSSATQAQANLNRLNATVTQTERELNNTSSAARSAAASLSGLASVAKIAATSISAISFRQAVQEMATFETKMLQLKALTMANETQMRSMEKQARTLGATTAFSAQQAAEAQGVLASTGLKVNEIMAATPKILQLAAAGNLDLAKSAEISMSTMKGLGLALTDLGHINDVFAKVAADSAISVEQVGIAMGEAAPSMRSFGVSLETTAAAIGILKDNGIKVGSIGDGLKSMMGALANETKEHTEILDKHNLSYKDLNVEQLGLIKVLNNLKDAHFTAREAIKLFGLDAFNVTTILQNNTKALADSSGALTKTSGDAQKQSEILNQGLAKAWDAFKGSLSEAALQLGEAGTKFDDTGKASGSLKSELTDLIQEVTGVIAIYENLGDEFAKSNKLTVEQYGHLKDVAGALRSFGGAVEGVVLLTGAIYGLRAAQLAFNAAAAMNPYIAGATALAAGVGYTVDKMNQYNDRQKGHLKEVKTLEESNLNIQKQQLAVKNLTDLGGNTKALEIAKEHLKVLEKQRDEFKAMNPSTEIKKPAELVKAHSLSLDDNTEKVKKSGGAKKGLSDAQKEVNHQQEEYQRLIESTPYGEYNAQVDKLTSALKNGGINQQTYSTLLSESNEKLLTSTDYVKEHTRALDEQARATERAFEATARGKFEKTDAELRAGRGGMSEGEYLNKQKEMVDAYLKDTGNFKKDNSEELTKAYENEIEALEKIRREIQLNDREQYESTQRHKGFTDQKINDLMRLYDEVGSVKLFDDMGLSSRKLVGTFSSMFQQIAVQGKSFTEALRNTFQSMIGSISDGLIKMGLSSGNIFAAIGGVAVGLLSRLLPKDKTTDIRLADTSLSDSNSIQNVIRALNDIHAKEYKELQGINDNFTMLSKGIDNTIARAIAWNGSFTPSTAGMKSNQTVANKNPAGSPAMIAGGIAASTAAGAAGIGASAAAMAGLGGLSTSMSGAAISTGLAMGASSTSAIAVGGAVLGLAGGVIFAALQYGLGKLLGIGKTKYEAIGAGLVTQPAKMIDLAAGKAFEAYNFSTVKATTKGWISNTTKIFDVINGYNDQMSDAFGTIFGGLFKTLDDTVAGLGIKSTGVQQSLENAVVPMMKTTLSGKTDSEVSDIITKLVNTMTDKLATEIVGGMVAPFQKAGEATLETLYRLTTQVAVVKGAFHKLGLETNLTGMGAIAFADSISTIYESSINAKDGMKQFTGAINDFYNAVLTTGEKTALTISDYKSFVSQNPQLGLSADPSKVSGAEMMAAFTKAKESSESAAKAADSILAIGQDVKNAYAPETSNELKTLLTSSAWSDKISGDYKNITPESFAAGWWDIVTKRAATSGQENQNLYQEMVRVAETNAAKKAQALPVVQTAGIASIEQQEQAALAATQSVDLAAKDLKKVTDMAGAFSSIVNEFQAKYKAIDESILKSATTEQATLKRARDKELIELKKVDDVRVASFEISEQSRNAYAKFTNTTVEANDKIGYLTSTLQEVAWAAEETDKALKKLSEGGKYLMDFSRSIDAWIRNLRATSLGTPESQLKASQANFGEQMKLAQFGATAEIKRQALSGITGYADTYINALRNYYASSEEGVNAIEQVIKEVSGLEKGLSIQELQLNELQSIKDAIDASAIEIPKGISEDNAKLFGYLIDTTKSLGILNKTNPTVESTLKYDAFASIILAIDKSAKSGADADFINQMIDSVSGNKGMRAYITMVINDAEFSASQKESIINGVIADFNRQINFDVAKSFETEIERVNNAWLKVELPTTTTDIAKTSVTGLSGGLKDLNGQYDVVIVKTGVAGEKIVDFSNIANKTKFGLDADSVANTVSGFKQITDSALAAKAAMNDLSMSQSQQPKPDYTYGGNLEAQAVNAGYSGDYTDTAAMQAAVDAASSQQIKDSYYAQYTQLVDLANSFTDLNAFNAFYDANPEKRPENLYKPFAKGGIAHTASIFGEAGAEAAVPLPDGRTIPVTLSRDSANDNGETVAELREISRKQEVMINTLIAAAQENRKQNAALVTEIEGLRTDTRLRRAA